MTKPLFISLLLVTASIASAQIAGGAGAFGGGRPKQALSQEQAKRGNRNPVPPNANSTFVDASVLINRKADEYVAVFGITQEGKDIQEARAKIDAIVDDFDKRLTTLGIKKSDTYLDFVSQNRIYGIRIDGDVAREEVVGFEVKKNIAIHYKAATLINQLTEVASQAQIYDLIKVDYVVRDTTAIQNQLLAEASKIIRAKVANRAKLLGTKPVSNPQIYTEDYASYYPTNMYSTYVAQESESMGGYRPNMITINARKNNTAYFDPLGQESFDKVINPIVTEPVVQFTLYLRILYSNGAAPAKK